MPIRNLQHKSTGRAPVARAGALATAVLVSALVTCSGALGGASAAAASTPQLSCAPVGIFAVPPVTNSWSEQGSDAKVTVGVSSTLGSIGVELGLTNTHASDQPSPVNVIDGKSAGGGGWQTSYWLEQPDQYLEVFNQAAGNAVGEQWGYNNTFTGSAADLWDPIWSDHYQVGSFGNPSVGTSPCPPPAGTSWPRGVSYDNGRLALSLGQVPTPAGTAIRVQNDYQLQSSAAQSWPVWALEQALYLSKQVAQEGDLRVYLHGHDPDGQPWVDGPIDPAQDSFSVPNGSGGCTVTADPTQSGCSFDVNGLDYAVFVYDIFGEDIAVSQVTHGDYTWYLSMNDVQPGVYCPDAPDISCGDIEVHDFETLQSPATIASGQVRDYPVTYLIGTPAQLDMLGYGP